MSAYRVCGPLAVVKDSTGKLHYYYEGTVVPDGIPGEELERLAEAGLLEKVDEDGGSGKAPRKSAAKDDGGSGG